MIVVLAPRPPQGRAGPEVHARARSPTRLGELLGSPVAFADRHGRRVGAGRRRRRCGDGEVALLENLRFNPGETSKDDAERGAFADQLAAFGRRVRRRRVRRGAPQARQRVRRAGAAAALRRRPGAARGRGAAAAHRATPSARTSWCSAASKVSDKLAVIEALLPKVDRLLVGGGMCFTFLKAQGHEVGKSLLEADMVDTCRDLLARGRRQDRAADRRRGRDRVRRRRRARRRSPPTRSRPTGSAWTSARRAAAAFAEALGRRPDRLLERPDGRVRAGAVRGRHPRASPRRSPRSTASPSSAAATRPRRCARSASTRRRSGTSRPAAARRWSTSRARPCPAWPPGVLTWRVPTAGR